MSHISSLSAYGGLLDIICDYLCTKTTCNGRIYMYRPLFCTLLLIFTQETKYKSGYYRSHSSSRPLVGRSDVVSRLVLNWSACYEFENFFICLMPLEWNFTQAIFIKPIYKIFRDQYKLSVSSLYLYNNIFGNKTIVEIKNYIYFNTLLTFVCTFI